MPFGQDICGLNSISGNVERLDPVISAAYGDQCEIELLRIYSGTLTPGEHPFEHFVNGTVSTHGQYLSVSHTGSRCCEFCGVVFMCSVNCMDGYAQLFQMLLCRNPLGHRLSRACVGVDYGVPFFPFYSH